MSAPASLSRPARLAITVFLGVYGLVCLVTPGTYRFLDHMDLAIHEAGHIVFAPFGKFAGFAGGTLLQVIVPTAFVVYFFRRPDRHAASVALWWVAQSLWNVAVYVRDARAMALPLVGGGEHDWNYLLGTLGGLQHDQALGRGVHSLGGLIFVLSLVWGLLALPAEAATAPQQAPDVPGDGPTADLTPPAASSRQG